MTSPIIELQNLSKVYATSEIETVAVNEISLSINPGEYVAVSGPSGGGKSSLMAVLGLLDSPSSGKYIFDGIDTTTMTRGQKCDLRNSSIGFIFQSFNLIETMTALENVSLPLVYRDNLSVKEAREKASAALKKVEMSHRLNHLPTQLSGGQQQRVAVARAMVTDPKVIFADEPTGNLDSTSAEIVMRLIKEQHDAGSTIFMVTHDPRYTKDASRSIQILDGKLLQAA